MRASSYEHVALFHEGHDDLARRLAPSVASGLRRGESVLVCIDGPAWDALARALGEDAGRVTHLAAGDRYLRPPVALDILHRFVTDAVDAGAPAAWSIGTIAYDGTDADEQWIRYEAAIDDVLGHLPLRAVCTYDLGSLPDAIVASARQTHAHLDTATGRQASLDYEHRHDADRRVARIPAAAPRLDVVVESSADVRRMLADAFGRELTAQRLADLHLVASELVANAVRHGVPPVHATAWLVDGAVTLQVVDDGRGISHRYPELRPPAVSPDGGYGLWLVGQVSDDVVAEHDGTRTVVTVTLAA